MSVEPEKPPLSFDRFTIEYKRRLLLTEGKPVSLDAKAFDLLAYLIDHRAEPTPRDRILKDVWSGKTVSESNLNVQLSALRVALRKAGCPNQLILTSPGPCYRFIGEVRDTDLQQAPASEKPAYQFEAPKLQEEPTLSTRKLFDHRTTVVFSAAATLLLLLSFAYCTRLKHSDEGIFARLSIVVLPVTIRSDDKHQNYLADELTDDLTTDLSRIPASTVIARESANKVKDKTPQQLGNDLQVHYSLSISMSMSDKNVHIEVRLNDNTNGALIWADRFDVPLTPWEDARETIVRKVVSALDGRLTSREGALLENRPDDPDALTLFYHARSLIDRDDSLAGLTTAQEELEQSILLQPKFVDALALLGFNLLTKAQGADDPDNDLDLARASVVIKQALHLDPRNPTALVAEARLQMSSGQCPAAITSAEKALESEPANVDALALLAKCSLASSNLEDAASYEEKVLQLNPESNMRKIRFAFLAHVYLLQGKYQKALQSTYSALGNDLDLGSKSGPDSMGRLEYCTLIQIAALQLIGESARAHAEYLGYNKIWPYRSVWRVSAYANGGVAKLQGYATFLRALNSAGMQNYADENVDDHVLASNTIKMSHDFDPTPLTLPGGIRIHTSDLASLLKESNPVIIDLGRGAAVIHGAFWLDYSLSIDSDEDFINRILQEEAHRMDVPVVMVGTGTYGLDSYLGALHAIALGYKNVFWYRGGEEAWARNKEPSVDRRPN